ncbi:MAG TPA: hypothetical protein VD908_02830 [Cytophagales bacterium]|nr:hypothetical protein [Cytophagales bacterium]
MKKNIYLYILLFFVLSYSAYSQGCVAIRSGGMACSVDHPTTDANGKGWQLNASYRYFKSFRHFKGRTEQLERLEKNTEVINWSHSLDLSIARQFNHRWSASIGLPLLKNDRSSLYEHGLTERHTSSSGGIGDLRIMANRWMLDPAKSKKINFQLGLGIKLPTGNYRAKDEFQNVGPEGKPEERFVDQSIQLGDGGVGGLLTVDAYFNLSRQFSLYGNLFYLSNPRNTNGTRTYLETLSAKYADDRRYMSVPDQYMTRIGANYSPNFIHGMSVGAGFRIEGLPSSDLIGKSEGWRRPGYIFSLEPGVSYKIRKVNFYASVPVALQRNRVQSVQDKKETEKVGHKVVGDAAFADYTINFGAIFNF